MRLCTACIGFTVQGWGQETGRWDRTAGRGLAEVLARQILFFCTLMSRGTQYLVVRGGRVTRTAARIGSRYEHFVLALQVSSFGFGGDAGTYRFPKRSKTLNVAAAAGLVRV